MPTTRSGVILLSIFLLAAASALHAEEAAFEQHGPHVHGHARLLIAQQGDALEMELVSPAMNIVGFEHRPTSNAQLDAMASAMATLRQPAELFELPADAACKVQSVEVHTTAEHHHEHEDHNREQDASQHEDEEGHSDIAAHYRFQCGDVAQLEQIGVNIFKLFPGTRVIQVQMATERGQRETDLTPEQHTLTL